MSGAQYPGGYCSQRHGECLQIFGELAIGNVKEQPLTEIWNSARYDRLRRILDEGLSPACSKCNVLYLNTYAALTHV